MKQYLPLIILATALCACDQISIDDVTAHEPIIESFSPKSAPVGAEIIVTGQYLHDVTSAKIAGVDVEISQKVSNTRLSIIVAPGIESGPISLVNSTGEGISSENFSCNIAIPGIFTEELPSSVDMGSELLITGVFLNSVRSVSFMTEGYDRHQATILSQSDDEIIVKVPYTEHPEARLIIEYNNGAEIFFTPFDSAPEIRVVKYVPQFDVYTFSRATAGTRLVLTGRYLNNIEAVTFDGIEADIVAEPEKLTITIPSGEFTDGANFVELKVIYFEGQESQILESDFELFVPYIKVWTNKTIVTQGRWDGSSWCAFFSPETGVVYENSKWETDLDPVAVELKGSQWGAGNVPKPGIVSNEAYDSVLPYFFFSAGSDKAVTLQSPANSTGQLKNIYKANDSKTSITGGNSWPGTPIMEYILLDKNSANAAEVALYNKVVSGQLEKIDEQTFAIDREAKTLGGIAVASKIKASYASWNSKYTGWRPEQSTYTSDLADDKLNAVFIIIYYSNNGWNSATPLDNIKRLGILHITEVDWGIDAGQFRRSFITFDCYWMKEDYDYSKITL